jgi:hypothetical protein
VALEASSVPIWSLMPTSKFETNTYISSVSGHPTKLPLESSASRVQQREAEIELAMKEEAARGAAVIENMHAYEHCACPEIVKYQRPHRGQGQVGPGGELGSLRAAV